MKTNEADRAGVFLRLPADLVADAKALAVASGQHMTGLIVVLLRRHLAENRKLVREGRSILRGRSRGGVR